MKKWLNPALVFTTSVLVVACAATNQDVNSKEPTKLVSNHSDDKVYTAPKFKEDAPNRYVVRSGDTLWSISERFLESPWRWKEVWHQNPQIKNPNLIYPGDIIAFTTISGEKKLQIAGSTNPNRLRSTGKKTSDGRPVYELKPSVQYGDMEEIIPTIPREAIAPFMNKNVVLTAALAEDNPYIVGDAGGSFLSLSSRSTVYAKANSFDNVVYDVYRSGDPIVDPVTDNQLGIEATYVGKVERKGEPNVDGIAPFSIIDNAQPLYPNDILLPESQSVDGGSLNFLPKVPTIDRDFSVIRPIADFSKSTAVQFDTILVNGGSSEGIEEGFVYKIVRGGTKTAVGRDGKNYRLPDYDLGIAVVYKVYDQVSYAIIMNAYDVIYANDRLVNP